MRCRTVRISAIAGLLFLGLAAGPAEANLPSVTIPSGTRLEVVLGQRLSTQTNKVGDTFSVSLAKGLVIDGETVLAEGTALAGAITDLFPAWKKEARLTLVLDRLLLEGKNGVAIPIATQPLTLKRQENKRATMLGAVLGGVVGAVIGVLLGGGEPVGMAITAGATLGWGAAELIDPVRDANLVLAPKKRLVFRLIEDVTIEKR